MKKIWVIAMLALFMASCSSLGGDTIRAKGGATSLKITTKLDEQGKPTSKTVDFFDAKDRRTAKGSAKTTYADGTTTEYKFETTDSEGSDVQTEIIKGQTKNIGKGLAVIETLSEKLPGK